MQIFRNYKKADYNVLIESLICPHHTQIAYETDHTGFNTKRYWSSVCLWKLYVNTWTPAEYICISVSPWGAFEAQPSALHYVNLLIWTYQYNALMCYVNCSNVTSYRDNFRRFSLKSPPTNNSSVRWRCHTRRIASWAAEFNVRLFLYLFSLCLKKKYNLKCLNS